MAGILDRFRRDIAASVWKDPQDAPKAKDINDKIALGVLLWAVAEADNKFLPQEEEEIKEVLKRYSGINGEDLEIVLRSVKAAAKQRIDLYRFTSEVSEGLPYAVKTNIVEQLFRVACSDKELDDREVETIRKISGLFGIGHKDFIDTKIKVKKEFGLDTAGF